MCVIMILLNVKIIWENGAISCIAKMAASVLLNLFISGNEWCHYACQDMFNLFAVVYKIIQTRLKIV